MTEALAVIVGLAILIGGGELVVRGASRLASSLGLSPVVIGLTIVAFGTSAPELAVSLNATVGGSPDVAIGNVVGSNIYNILLILGIAALIRPLGVNQRLVRFDVPLVIAVSVLLWVLVLDGTLAALEGVLLAALLVGYLAYSLRVGRRTPPPSALSEHPEVQTSTAASGSRARDGATFVAGLVVLVLGAQLVVSGASAVARSFGVPELVVGLTIVAIGTSLPELVTSAVAAFRGERDLAIGNVMGSNLFNILGILGLTALISGDGLAVAERVRAFDIPVMTLVALACLPLLFTGYQVRRWEGALFVAYAVVYTAYLVLDATGNPLVEGLGQAVVLFAVPLTAVVILSVLTREIVTNQRRRTGRLVPSGMEVQPADPASE
jgi:cation:H+ antiporter